jgi:hypothetical protein
MPISRSGAQQENDLSHGFHVVMLHACNIREAARFRPQKIALPRLGPGADWSHFETGGRLFAAARSHAAAIIRHRNDKIIIIQYLM